MLTKGYQKQKSNKTVKSGLESVSMKPTLYLTDKDLPELKDWETGKIYKLEITVKQISKSEHSTSSGKEMTGTFDITNISVDDDNDEEGED